MNAGKRPAVGKVAMYFIGRLHFLQIRMAKFVDCLRSVVHAEL